MHAEDDDETRTLDALRAHEPLFHRRERGTDFAALIVDDYWEVGASGRIYDRATVLDVLAKRHAGGFVDDVWATSDFACRRLSDDTYLLTYTLVQDGARTSRRSTIWRRTVDGWRAVFHQGTLLAAPDRT